MEVEESVKYKEGFQLGDLECRPVRAPSPPCPVSRPAPLPVARSPPEPFRATASARAGTTQPPNGQSRYRKEATPPRP